MNRKRTAQLVFVPWLASALLVIGGGFEDLLGQEPSLAVASGVRSGGMEFRFATVEEGRAVLGADDEYVQSLSPFDRQARTQSDHDPGKAAFLQNAADAVIEWPEPERLAIRKALELLDEPLNALDLPKVSPVMLVYTSGREESGAAYTRGAAIVLPRGKAGSVAEPVTKLIVHELFHVLSRSDPAWRDRLYSIIGFRAIDDVQLPNEIADRRITNPDAPRLSHAIRLRLDEERSVDVTPVLIAKSAFDPANPFLFGYVDFKLLEIKQDIGDRWIANVVNGEVVLHDASIPDYHRQIGWNTGYIIHPDEILADNFVLLVTGAKAKDEWVIDAMRAQF